MFHFKQTLTVRWSFCVCFGVAAAGGRAQGRSGAHLRQQTGSAQRHDGRRINGQARTQCAAWPKGLLFFPAFLEKIWHLTFFSTKSARLFFLQWYIQATCATQGQGLYEGLDWLSNELAKWLSASLHQSARFVSKLWVSFWLHTLLIEFGSIGVRFQISFRLHSSIFYNFFLTELHHPLLLLVLFGMSLKCITAALFWPESSIWAKTRPFDKRCLIVILVLLWQENCRERVKKKCYWSVPLIERNRRRNGT